MIAVVSFDGVLNRDLDCHGSSTPCSAESRTDLLAIDASELIST